AATWITEEEFVGPFPSWADVKTEFGAVGNGVADDTAALQNALNALGRSGLSVIYLPAGTYKITNTLILRTRINVSIIGEHPDTTKSGWAGGTNDVMLRLDGVAYSRVNRLTFGGAKFASVGIDQSWGWPTTTAHFDTGNEYADDVFIDLQYGIRGGAYGH